MASRHAVADSKNIKLEPLDLAQVTSVIQIKHGH